MHDTEGTCNWDGTVPLLLGPGERLALLHACLAGLAAEPAAGGGAGGDGGDVERLAELAAVLDRREERGLLVLDGDGLTLADVSLVRAFLARRTGWELVLAGEDAGGSAVRRLLGHPRVSFLPWPLDLEQAAALGRAARAGDRRRPPAGEPAAVGAAAAEAAGGPFGAVERAAPTGKPHAGPEPFRPADPELAVIEELLGAPPRAAGAGPARPAAPRGAPPPTASPPTESPSTASPPPAAPAGAAPAPADRAEAETAGSAPPPYFKEQVADLADIAQRLHLCWQSAADERLAAQPGAGAAPSRRFVELGEELERLLQFTRTLGFVAAPPARGDLRLDLTRTAEELVRTFARTGPDAPKVLFRAGPPLPVRADKALLTQAFDALFFLAQTAAGAGGEVRVETVAEAPPPEAAPPADAAAGSARLGIEFPPGPLEGFPLRRVLEPYALRRRVPDLGPNALAAAAGIVRGQGGSLEVGARASGRLGFLVRLPLAAPAEAVGPAASPTPPAARPAGPAPPGEAAGRADDPFA